MHIGFLNPQGNFDPQDRYWTQHPDFGGQLVYVKQVANALVALGHDVDILTRRFNDPDWPGFGDATDSYPEGARIVRLHAGDSDRFVRKEDLWPLLARDWVPNILAFYGAGLPDVFTAHYGDGGLSGALLRARTQIPYTFTAHSLGAQKRDGLLASGTGIDEDRYRFTRRLAAERVAMNRAGVIVTSTNQERSVQYAHPAYAEAVDPTDDERFAVIPPGVDQTIFSPGEADKSTVEHIGTFLARDLDADRLHLPAVVASSRLDAKKNHRVLVDAFGRNEQLRSVANLVVITGALADPLREDGSATPSERSVLADLRAAISDGDLDGKVSGFAIRGQRSLADAYRFFAKRQSVFALTALYEPFGLAPLEAASTGLPVVVTRNGGPVESFGDSEYGVLVDPSDPDDVARGLLRALSEWNHFAKAGRQRVLDRYTWERTAEGYVAAIDRALADRNIPTEPIPEFTN